MNATHFKFLRPFVLTLCAVALAVHGGAAQEEKPRLAVLTWEARNASPAEAEAVTEQVRAVLTQSGRFLMVDRTLTAKILEEWERQQSGLNEAERAVRVGKLYNVRFIVAGKLIPLDAQGWLVSAAMLDSETGVTSGAQTLPHQGEFFPLLGMIPALTARLAGLETSVPPPPPPPPQQAALAVPQPGALWREPITGMEFVYVPGGEYEQGCGHWTSDCEEDEKPTRRVTLSPFWLGKTEVTQGQWKQVMATIPASFKKGDNYPVETVSWNEAREFIRRLNARSQGVKFRLPTEAQWEYACRAGGKPVAYGTASGDWIAGAGNASGTKDGHEQTAPVGSFAPNSLGLHDLSGNVWEWTQDAYAAKAYQSGPASDPIYEGSGDQRVFRGGGWLHDQRRSRCSHRGWNFPLHPRDDLGFRLARAK